MRETKLMKYLQGCGLASRRQLRQWIHEGRFTVDGRVIDDPAAPLRPGGQVIRLDGRPLKLAPQPRSYFVLNKPGGVVSTLSDPEGRPTVRDFIAGIRERVYPVGRLDFHSDGLMLLTNDGELAEFILAARNGVPKTYLLKVKGALGDAARQKLERGFVLDGERLRPFVIEETSRTGGGHSWLRVTIREGKKHILRKAFLYAGHPVEKLRRVAIGTLKLGHLPPGHWRELRAEEIAAFKSQFRYGQAISGKREGREREEKGKKK
jgi:23S rRNA pseudouridine2605 synthase